MGHRVHSTFGGNLHQLIVKGFSNAPFPLIYNTIKKRKKQGFFEDIFKKNLVMSLKSGRQITGEISSSEFLYSRLIGMQSWFLKNGVKV